MILVGTLHFAIFFKNLMTLIKCSFATIPINTFSVIYIVCFPCTCRSRRRFRNHMGVAKGERSITFSIRYYMHRCNMATKGPRKHGNVWVRHSWNPPSLYMHSMEASCNHPSWAQKAKHAYRRGTLKYHVVPCGFASSQV